MADVVEVARSGYRKLPVFLVSWRMDDLDDDTILLRLQKFDERPRHTRGWCWHPKVREQVTPNPAPMFHQTHHVIWPQSELVPVEKFSMTSPKSTRRRCLVF